MTRRTVFVSDCDRTPKRPRLESSGRTGDGRRRRERARARAREPTNLQLSNHLPAGGIAMVDDGVQPSPRIKAARPVRNRAKRRNHQHGRRHAAALNQVVHCGPPADRPVNHPTASQAKEAPAQRGHTSRSGCGRQRERARTVGHCLQRLSKTHLIGQQAAPALVPVEEQPVQTRQLVLAQLPAILRSSQKTGVR